MDAATEQNDDPQYLKDKIKDLVRVLNPLMDIAKKREGACFVSWFGFA